MNATQRIALQLGLHFIEAEHLRDENAALSAQIKELKTQMGGVSETGTPTPSKFGPQAASGQNANAQ